MTVIAYRNGIMAADKYNLLAHSAVAGITTKIRNINGTLVGISGKTVLAQAMFKWAEGGFKPEEMPESQKDPEKFVVVVCIPPDGSILLYETSPYPMVNQTPFIAIGSGSDIAHGSMAHGATALQAVEYACLLSPWCGGGIDVLHLNPSETEKE